MLTGVSPGFGVGGGIKKKQISSSVQASAGPRPAKRAGRSRSARPDRAAGTAASRETTTSSRRNSEWLGVEHVVGHAGERNAGGIDEKIGHPNRLRHQNADAAHRDQQRILRPDSNQRENQRDVAEIQENSSARNSASRPARVPPCRRCRRLSAPAECAKRSGVMMTADRG